MTVGCSPRWARTRRAESLGPAASRSRPDARSAGSAQRPALVIGCGITEDRLQDHEVHNPHGFSIAWLRAEPGQGVSAHRHEALQVFMVMDVPWRITLNRKSPAWSEIGPLDTFSVPVGAWHRIESIGDQTGQPVA